MIKEVTVKKGGKHLTELGVSWVEAASEDMKKRVERGVPEVIVLKQDIEVETIPEENILKQDVLSEEDPLSDEELLSDEDVLSDEEEEFYDTEQSPTTFNKDIIFDNLKPSDDKGAVGKERYIPFLDSTLTMLGDEQWQWLSQKMYTSTDYRFIISSIQFLAIGHGW